LHDKSARQIEGLQQINNMSRHCTTRKWSMIHSFIHSFIYSLIHLFIDPSIDKGIHLFIRYMQLLFTK